MPIRAVLFDLDNTLTHRDLSIQAYARFFMNHYAAQIQHSDVSKMIDVIRDIDNGGYPIAQRLTHPSIAASVAAALLQQLHWENGPNLEALTAFWFENFGRHAVAMPDAEKLLTQLKNQGYLMAVVSNGGHATRLAILEGLGFTHYFEHVISSESAGAKKPDSSIFLTACRLLDVSPEQCIFIGDHPLNDIDGAQQVGMQTIWLAGFHPAPLEHHPHVQVECLAQVYEVLLQR